MYIEASHLQVNYGWISLVTQSRHMLNWRKVPFFFELPGRVDVERQPVSLSSRLLLEGVFAKRPEFGWCVVERDLIKLGHQNSAVRTLQYSINSFESKQF